MSASSRAEGSKGMGIKGQKGLRNGVTIEEYIPFVKFAAAYARPHPSPLSRLLLLPGAHARRLCRAIIR